MRKLLGVLLIIVPFLALSHTLSQEETSVLFIIFGVFLATFYMMAIDWCFNGKKIPKKNKK